MDAKWFGFMLSLFLSEKKKKKNLTKKSKKRKDPRETTTTTTKMNEMDIFEPNKSKRVAHHFEGGKFKIQRTSRT